MFIFAHSYSYHERAKGKLTLQAPLNSSVLRRVQKQECNKDRSRTAAESELQAAGAKLLSYVIHIVIRDSRQRGILRSRRECDRIDVIDQSSLTLGCTCLSGITVRCDEGTC